MEKLINTLNTAAEVWASSIWFACWQGGIALVFVWLIIRFLPNISPSIQCWLWRLAILKLLVSFLWMKPIELPLLPAANESFAHAPAQELKMGELASKLVDLKALPSNAFKPFHSDESIW